MFCSKCGNQVEDGSRFCLYCGNRFEAQEQIFVQQPAAPAYKQEDNDAFFVQEEQPPVFYPAQPSYMQQPAKKKLPDLKIPKKFLLMGCGVIAAVLLVIILISSFSSGGKNSYALYLKEGQIFYHNISGKESNQITDDLTDGRDVDNSTLKNLAYSIGESLYLTQDGKTLFYMDEVDGTGKLFCQDLTNFKKEPIQIASGVEEYAVSGNGKEVFFLKNGTLYRYDGKDDEKIARDVEEFVISGNGDVIYQNEDDIWYFIFNGKEEKLGSEIDIVYVTEKGVVYYQDEDRLYRKSFGADKEKLLSDVYEIRNFEEDGTFYFSRREPMTLADFFREDAEYEYWMQSLREYEYTPYFSLYYFNGKEEILLTDGCVSRRARYTNDSLMMFYTCYDLTAVPELSYQKLEEMCNSEEYYYESIYYVAELMLLEALEKNMAAYGCIEGQISRLEVDNIHDYVCSADGKSLYLLCDVDEEKETGTIFKANISGKKIETPEKMDEDVYSENGFYCIGENHFVYFKNVKDYEGELFINGVSVAEDVYVNSYVRYNDKKDAILFITDFADETAAGTLCSYHSKKTEEIVDDVVSYIIGPNGDVAICYDYDRKSGEGSLAVYNGKLTEVTDDLRRYTFTPAGDLLFLYDYNSGKCRGSLAVFTGGKVKELDEDVAELITINTDAYSYCQAPF